MAEIYKQIKDFTLKNSIDGTEDILIQSNGVTMRVKSSQLKTSIDLSNYYTKSEVDNLLADIDVDIDMADYYDKATIDNLLLNKANVSHTHTSADITDLSIPTVDVNKAYVDSQLANKSNTNHTHDEYISETELNEKGYATETYVQTKIVEVATGGTVNLSNYATKTELTTELNKKANLSHTHNAEDINGLNIPTKLSELQNDSGFISEVPSEYINETELNNALANKANTSDIPSLTGYATETYVMNKLGGKSLIYLTQSEYDLLSDTEKQDSTKVYNITDAVIDYNELANTPTIPTKTSELNNDSGFITSVPSEYITETELSAKSYATETYVTNKIAEASLSGGEVDLSGLATKDELATKADKTAIPTKVSQLTNDKGYLTSHQDISGKADKTYVDAELAKKANVSHTHSYNDLTDKPTIPSTANLATKKELTDGLATKANVSHTHDQYLTEHQDLSDYALKTELPTVPTKVSELANDSGFIKSIPSEYVTETELDAKGYLTEHQDISNLQEKTDNNLNTTDKTIVGAINELKTSVSDGKTLIASAITDKGIVTSDTDTFQTMATNIGLIKTSTMPETTPVIYDTINGKLYRRILDEDFDNQTSINKNYFMDKYGIASWGKDIDSARNNYIIEDSILKLIIDENTDLWSNDSTSYASSIATGLRNGFHPNTTERKNIYDSNIPYRTYTDKFLGFIMQYGRLEIKCKIPYGYDHMCAVWLLGIQDTIEQTAEIDIMEASTGHSNTGVSPTIHKWYDPNIKKATGTMHADSDISENYHIFTIEWSETGNIIFSIDGIEKLTLTEQIISYPLSLLVDHYMLKTDSPWWGNNGEKGTLPCSFDIDYIRAWKPAKEQKSVLSVVNQDEQIYSFDYYTDSLINEYKELKKCPSFVRLNWNDGTTTEHWVKWQRLTNNIVNNVLKKAGTYTLTGIIQNNDMNIDFTPILTVNVANDAPDSTINLYDSTVELKNVYIDSTGNEVVSNNNKTYDSFINVISGLKYTIGSTKTFNTSAKLRVIEYDDNESYITRTINLNNPCTITLKSNTKKIKIGFSDFNDNEIDSLKETMQVVYGENLIINEETYGNIVVSTKNITLSDIGNNSEFTVSLDKAPTNNQIITLSSSNENITLDKTTLTFTASNYSNPQTVIVTGQINGSSIITLTSTGVSNTSILVNVGKDNELIFQAALQSEIIDNTIADLSGNNNNLTVIPKTNGGTNSPLANGYDSTGKFIRFNKYYAKTSNTITVPSEFTIITRFRGYSISRQSISVFRFFTHDYKGMNLTNISTDNLCLSVTGDSNVKLNNLPITFSDENGSFYELAIVVNGNSLAVYIDGNLYNNLTVNNLPTDYTLYLAGYDDSNSKLVDFKKFRIYNKALTEAEISEINAHDEE